MRDEIRMFLRGTLRAERNASPVRLLSPDVLRLITEHAAQAFRSTQVVVYTRGLVARRFAMWARWRAWDIRTNFLIGRVVQ